MNDPQCIQLQPFFAMNYLSTLKITRSSIVTQGSFQANRDRFALPVLIGISATIVKSANLQEEPD
jgi:hypothetical protein